MNMLSIRFNKFICTMLKVLLILIIIAGTMICIADFDGFTLMGTIVITSILSGAVFCEYKIIRSELKLKNKIIFIFLIAIILRILWLLNTDNTPNSDFAVMYYSAGELLNGNSSILKGVNYAGRFPHIIPVILYMAFMKYVFPQYNIIAMKIANLILGMVVLELIYLISSEVFKEKKYAIYSLCLAVIFPPLITYTTVFCSENLAMPFYLLSILLFIKNIDKSKTKSIFFILSSIFLGVGNVFRMIGGVILIAYMMYILIYNNEKILRKLKNIVCIIVPYLLVMVLISSFLQNISITDEPLWRGTEPKITSVLKGTNISSLGMWNIEDAEMVEKYTGDYDKIESECRRVIYERLTTTPVIKLAGFYLLKLSSQWCIGDFSGAFWTQKDMPDEKIVFKIGKFGFISFQLIYVLVLIFMFRGLKENHLKENKYLSLFYIIFLGYIAAYLITENQCRYGYIVCWNFIILGIDGLRGWNCKGKIYKIKGV